MGRRKLSTKHWKCSSIREQPKALDNFAYMVEYVYNTGYHSSMERSPFEMLYGRPPPTLKDYIPCTTKVPEVEAQLRDKDKML